jgi:hypothetical protein
MNAPNEKHVFVSHSSKDDVIGRRLCAALERSHIRCWYSSRPSDLEPGSEWDDNIVAALDRSVALVLLFSSAANESRWVKRELSMAGRRELPVFPIRIENVLPSGGMEPYLISVQWTDAFGREVEDCVSFIIAKLRPHFPLPEAKNVQNAPVQTMVGQTVHISHDFPRAMLTAGSPTRPGSPDGSLAIDSATAWARKKKVPNHSETDDFNWFDRSLLALTKKIVGDPPQFWRVIVPPLAILFAVLATRLF